MPSSKPDDRMVRCGQFAGVVITVCVLAIATALTVRLCVAIVR